MSGNFAPAPGIPPEFTEGHTIRRPGMALSFCSSPLSADVRFLSISEHAAWWEPGPEGESLPTFSPFPTADSTSLYFAEKARSAKYSHKFDRFSFPEYPKKTLLCVLHLLK